MYILYFVLKMNTQTEIQMCLNLNMRILEHAGRPNYKQLFMFSCRRKFGKETGTGKDAKISYQFVRATSANAYKSFSIMTV